nr:type II toxin-antitoxin system Phd/YefM family antitoxin [uncultured Flavobacterium sp.]
MKQESIGDITRSGGFSRIVREVHDTGEPIKIIRNNEPVAVIIPADVEVIQVFEQSMMFGRAVREMHNKGFHRELELYLISQLLAGLQAKALFGLALDDAQLMKLEQSVIDACRNAVHNAIAQTISREEGGSAEEQPLAPVIGGSQGEEQSSPTSKRKKKN